MTIPLIILAVLSIIGGFFGIPELFAKDAHLLKGFLSGVVAPSGDVHQVSVVTEIILIGLLLAAVAFAIVTARKWITIRLTKRVTEWRKWLENKGMAEKFNKC